MHTIEILPGEYGASQWLHTAKDGWDAMFDPAYWSRTNYFRQFRPGDWIKVRSEDGTWSALLEMRVVSAQAVVVGVCWHKEWAEEGTVAVGDTYEIGWAGPVRRFRVVRTSDKQMMKDRFATRELAEEWIENHSAEVTA